MQLTSVLGAILLLVACLAASPVISAVHAVSGPASSPDGARIERVPVELEGWTLLVDEQLLEGERAAEVGARALELLRAQLVTIDAVLSDAVVARLREVKIAVDLEHELKTLQYHPGMRWLEQHGYDAELHKAVHLPDVGRFIALVESNIQPWVLLHELAHAWHDQVLGFDDEQVIEAWQRVRESGALATVLHASGRDREHYALTNPKEFFAEMSEAYIGTNDFYPFIRAELERSDPETLALMATKWKLGGER